MTLMEYASPPCLFTFSASSTVANNQKNRMRANLLSPTNQFATLRSSNNLIKTIGLANSCLPINCTPTAVLESSRYISLCKDGGANFQITIAMESLPLSLSPVFLFELLDENGTVLLTSTSAGAVSNNTWTISSLAPTAMALGSYALRVTLSYQMPSGPSGSHVLNVPDFCRVKDCNLNSTLTSRWLFQGGGVGFNSSNEPEDFQFPINTESRRSFIYDEGGVARFMASNARIVWFNGAVQDQYLLTQSATTVATNYPNFMRVGKDKDGLFCLVNFSYNGTSDAVSEKYQVYFINALNASNIFAYTFEGFGLSDKKVTDAEIITTCDGRLSPGK